jgi:MarR family transcriptional regulator, transcriptional regulator for hemolysin
MTDHSWDFERDPIFLIDDVARMTSARFNDWARSHSLTRGQCMTLKRLRDQPGASQNEVACLHKVEPITISRHLDKLELLGLIERRQDVGDRRIRRLRVLPEGDKLANLVDNYCDQLVGVLIDDLSVSDREILFGALLDMKNRLVDSCPGAREYEKANG